MNSEAEGREAAEAFRREHHLGDQPLGDLAALIERTTGHDVAVLDVEDPDEHGLAMRDPQRDVAFIAVARTRHPMRQRSSLAHELAHVVFGDWRDAGREELRARPPEESRADAFARHLLIPTKGLRTFLGDRDTLSETDLSATVQWFLVSAQIAAIALKDCGLIDGSTKTEWMELSAPRLATRYGWSDQYESLAAESDRTRSPQRLLARATAGYVEGVVSVQTVATLRGVTAEKAASDLEEAGLVPHPASVPSVTAHELPNVDVDLSALDEHDDHHDDHRDEAIAGPDR